MSRIYQNKPTTATAQSSSPVSVSKSPSPAPVAAASVVFDNHNHHNSTPSTAATDSKQLDRMEKLVNRLESIAARLENAASSNVTLPTAVAGHSSTHAAPAVVDLDIPSINAFNDLIDGPLKAHLDYSNQIGGDVKTTADMVKNLFNLEKAFLVQSTSSAQPSADVLMKALEPLSKIINDIQSFREKNRKSEFFNHLSAISESIGALGWVTVSPAPGPYIKEMNDAGQFYTNRVLKDFKEKDPSKMHVNWVQSWIKLLNELQAYVKEYHTRGVSWNPKGGQLDPSKVASTSGASVSKSSAPAPPAGGPPPPPPMPTFDLFADNNNSKSQQSQLDLQAQLAKELNVGTDITKTLKKVSDDQKTHKNTALRAGSTVPGSVSTASSAKSSTQQPAAQVTRPPKFELVDKKWTIEFQHGQQGLVVDNTELKQTVYVYKCKECTIQVKGKVNSILLDSCERVGVLFDDVLSTIEFINSKNVQAQVNGKVPTISIDKTDGCQVYLSKQSLDVEIVSSKSSAMNILIPTNVDGDYTEMPLPEQYKTTISGKKLVTVPTESG